MNSLFRMKESKTLKNVIFWNAISQFGNSGVSFLSTIILARFLTPADFGIIGIVTIFMGFSEMFIDGQMGGALLRKKDITQTDYDTLFWYNLIISIFFYLILWLTAPLIASFYERTELIKIIRILSLVIIIFALRVTQRVMIFRNMQFRIMSIINIVGGIIGLGSAIILAYKSYGYWSLILMQLVSAGTGLILMELYNKYIPKLSFSRASFKYQFHFGISLLGSEMIKTIVNNITTNVLGKVTSLSFTGLYTQSSRITNFIGGFASAILDQSIFPYMSKLRDINKIKNLYNRLLLMSTVITGILIIVFYIFSKQIIMLILGDNWISCVPIFKILSFAILPLIIQALSRNVLKTLGNTQSIFRIELYKSLILTIALICSIQISSIAIIWALVSVQFIGCLIWFVYANKLLRNGMFID